MDPPAFLADEMLGRLARTLRLLGFDVAYVQGATDAQVLGRSGGRTLLTRDVQLAERAARAAIPVVLVREVDHVAQAQEVVEDLALDVDPARVMTRCSACNALLVETPPDDRRGVPLHAEPPLWRCPGCGKRYWAGSHGPRIRDLAERLRRRGGP